MAERLGRGSYALLVELFRFGFFFFLFFSFIGWLVSVGFFFGQDYAAAPHKSPFRAANSTTPPPREKNSEKRFSRCAVH
jgi:uncharacterized protein involved in cysteine biosynthesis